MSPLPELNKSGASRIAHIGRQSATLLSLQALPYCNFLNDKSGILHCRLRLLRHYCYSLNCLRDAEFWYRKVE